MSWIHAETQTTPKRRLALAPRGTAGASAKPPGHTTASPGNSSLAPLQKLPAVGQLGHRLPRVNGLEEGGEANERSGDVMRPLRRGAAGAVTARPEWSNRGPWSMA